MSLDRSRAPMGGSDEPSAGADRRAHARHDTWLTVDVQRGDTFLFAYVTNVSEMGIFVRSEDPLPVGTDIKVRIASVTRWIGAPPLELDGIVAWINPYKPYADNPNPGMGVRFVSLTGAQRERLVQLVRTVAYLKDHGPHTD